MNKKLNAALFMIAALIFNGIIAIALLIGGILLIQMLLGKDPDQFASMIMYMVLAAIVFGGTFFIYNSVLKLLIKKTRLEEYLPESKKR
jgi:MFS-type transporter involved in bile tolerance (Atg22 family)